jgi:hypothetical protein
MEVLRRRLVGDAVMIDNVSHVAAAVHMLLVKPGSSLNTSAPGAVGELFKR